MDYPLMYAKDAVANRIKYFSVARGCRVCGDRRRWLPSWNLSFSACMTCEPETGVDITVKNIHSSETKRNQEIRKRQTRNWSIPTVYQGMNNK